MTSVIKKNRGRFSRQQELFIETQVNERLGRFCDPGEQTLSAVVADTELQAIKSAGSRPLLYFSMTQGGPETIFERRAFHRNQKFAEMLQRLRVPEGARFLADFQDNIASDYKPLQQLGVPIFSKARPLNKDSCVILWTHENYRKRRENGINGTFGSVAWGKKKPELIWRGAANGSVRLASGLYISAIGLYRLFSEETADSLLPVKETFANKSFEDIVNTECYRFRAVSELAERYDVRFTLYNRPEWTSFQDYLNANGYRFAEKITLNKLAMYKYFLVMGGGDAGSQIHWALSSNSVILMPPIVFNSTTTLGLREWEHFVPIAGDFSDLDEKVEWCRDNDAQCRLIAENAKAYVSQFEPRVEDEISQRVIDFYCYGVEKGKWQRSLSFLMGKR